MSTDMYRKCAKCGATPVQDGVVSFHRFPKPGKTNVERYVNHIYFYAHICFILLILKN